MASQLSSSLHSGRKSSSASIISSRSFLSKRVLVALLVCTLLLDLSSLAAEARPQDDPTSVAEAIRLLQELESKHAQHARPRLARSQLPPNPGLDKVIGYFILEAIDRAHSTDSRPRFGKRGYLSPVGYGGQDEQEDVWQDSTFAR
ncbi:neuropeptide F-like isoform X2 [Uranotaenia lowii]|uniref:neuropeptide F-like isoform X2 n=1 Tax=Uranotaenia lowii TaxID=190385 RepID=UPI0024794BB1|nr:neuropeptide F-like isoform X2 [Uranotaenia lowii]